MLRTDKSNQKMWQPLCEATRKFRLGAKVKSLALVLFAVFVVADINVLADNNRDGIKQGNATYYGNRWHGRRTSSGEVYHRDSLTCAHRTLPFGTTLLVKNKRNGKEVVVKVTDRGPFRKGAVVDLSMAAARKLDMVRDGVCPVEICMVDPGYVPTTVPYAKEADEPVLPELELLDPVTGNYYTMTEWQQREANRKEMAKTNAAKNPENFTAKAQPRYRVAGQQNMAKATQKVSGTTEKK